MNTQNLYTATAKIGDEKISIGEAEVIMKNNVEFQQSYTVTAKIDNETINIGGAEVSPIASKEEKENSTLYINDKTIPFIDTDKLSIGKLYDSELVIDGYPEFITFKYLGKSIISNESHTLLQIVDTKPKLYTKKPVQVEALQYRNYQDIVDFTNGTAHSPTESTCIIPTLEGEHIANKGDYIIKGVKGEFYPCKPDIFEMTYDKVE